MKHIDSFPYLLNEIFSELHTAASIVISYNFPPNNNAGPENERPAVTGVNGFKSLTTFTHYLYHLKNNLMAKLLEPQVEMETQARRLFVRQAIIRCRSYASVTIPLAEEDKPGSDPSYHRTRWGFYRPKFDHGQGPAPDANTRQHLIRSTQRYANMWRLIGEEFLDELHGLYYLVEFFPVLTQPPASKQVREKITVRVNVPELGATLRMFFDSRVFDLRNKEKLCRLVAGCFSTPRQQDISAGSLKNHFDAPTPETLDRICAAFGKIRNNSQKLKKVN